jgi:Ca2+-binding EF-hand superfamily protein
MKRLFQLILAVPLLAFMAAACAPVTEGVVSGAAEATTEQVLDSFDIFDEDSSGDISQAEYDNNVNQFDSDMQFEELDANEDGFVSEDEFEEFDG